MEDEQLNYIDSFEFEQQFEDIIEGGIQILVAKSCSSRGMFSCSKPGYGCCTAPKCGGICEVSLI